MYDVMEMGATTVPTGNSVRSCWQCHKCRVLFYCKDFAKKETIGICAGGERHAQATSTEYSVIDYGQGESGWRFCKYCAAVHLASSATAGTCVGNGSHGALTQVELRVEKAAKTDATALTHYWRRCSKCACLYMPASGDNGACPKGGKHDPAGSDVYKVDVQSSSGG